MRCRWRYSVGVVFSGFVFSPLAFCSCSAGMLDFMADSSNGSEAVDRLRREKEELAASQCASGGGEARAGAGNRQVEGGVGEGAGADRRVGADGGSPGRAVSAARGAEGGRDQATGTPGGTSGSAARASAARRSSRGSAAGGLSALRRGGARSRAAHAIHRGAAARAAGRDAADDVERRLFAVRRSAQHASAASLAGQGAAGVHLGPRAIAWATLLNKQFGIPLRKTCSILRAGLRPEAERGRLGCRCCTAWPTSSGRGMRPCGNRSARAP